MCTGVGRNPPCAPHDEPTTGRPSVALPATVNLVGFLVALNTSRMSVLVILRSLIQFWSEKIMHYPEFLPMFPDEGSKSRLPSGNSPQNRG